MTSKLKVNIIADSGDNTLLETNGSGTITTNNIGGENTPAFSAVLTSNQTIGNSTNSLIAFDTVEIDTDSAFTNTSSNYKFTVPSGKAGKYLISAIADMKGTGASSLIACRIQIYKNGSAPALGGYSGETNVVSSSYPTVKSEIICYADGDDYFEVVIYQNSGGSTVLFDVGMGGFKIS